MFIFEGDSHSDVAGTGIWPTLLKSSFGFFNREMEYTFATSGDTVANMLTEDASQAGSVPTDTVQESYYFLFAGANDLGAGTDATTIYNNLKTLWAANRSRGSEVVAFTLTPRLDGTTIDNQRIALNALIRSDPTLYDYLVRPDLYFPNTDDSSFYTATAHLTPLGNQILAQHVAAVIRGSTATFESGQKIANSSHYGFSVSDTNQEYGLDPAVSYFTSYFKLIASVSSPKIASLELPGGDTADHYLVSYETGSLWSTPQTAQPGDILHFGTAGADGLRVVLLDAHNVPAQDSPDFTFFLKFTSAGTFDGTVISGRGPTDNRDFDGNGKSDILWVNDNGQASIWDNGTISGAHIIAPAGTVANGWHFADTGDFDGNGKSDILWVNDDGKASIWDNGQIGGAHWIANPGTIANGWHFAGTGDFDGNGESDILWVNDDGKASVWDNGQIGGAHWIANPGTVADGWHFAGTGDFDGNGKSDILWVNNDGRASIWDNGQIAGVHIIANPGTIANGWHFAGTGDFDGNGKSDILWVNDDGRASVWDNGAISGAHIIAPAGTIANGWHFAGTGDFDGNGKSDILWVNNDGRASIWDNGAIGGAHIVAAVSTVANGWHFG